MTKDRCDFCGREFLEAMVAASGAERKRAGGDAVVAGMLSYVEGMQAGVAPLEECQTCGASYCRTCGERSSTGAGRHVNRCPRCSAHRTQSSSSEALRVAPPPPESVAPISKSATQTGAEAPSNRVDGAEFRRLVEQYLDRDPPWLGVLIGEQITPAVLEEVRRSIAPQVGSTETPILLHDWSGRKIGLLATDSHLYWRSAEKSYRRPYDEIRRIEAIGRVTLLKGRQALLDGDPLVIPIEFSYVGDMVIASLQIAAKQERPLLTEEELASKVRSGTGTAKGLLTLALFLLAGLGLVALGAAVVWAFIANPRLLVPILLGLMAAIHGQGRDPLTKITDWIVWVFLTGAMSSWIMDGFGS